MTFEEVVAQFQVKLGRLLTDEELAGCRSLFQVMFKQQSDLQASEAES